MILAAAISPAGCPDEVYASAEGSDGDMSIECEITRPPSMAGRRVTVWIDADQVTGILRAARDAGIAARSKPMDDQAEANSGPDRDRDSRTTVKRQGSPDG